MSAASITAIIDAFYLCLAASIIWAPIVFAGAVYLNRKAGRTAETAVWPAALVVAALPALAAPFAAAFGLSLRTAAPLPPMAAPEFAPARIVPETVTAAQPSAPVDLALVLGAAADLYFYGFVLFAALGVLRLVGFAYRVRLAYPIDDARLETGLDEWRRRMGVRGPVRFAYSDAVSSVCVHGFFRPVVLMPPSLLERASTDDAILMGAHELAHVKRGDTWLFAFCEVAKALFWFNPFMRRIVAHVQLAAEQGADALVIRRGANRKSYARCFVESLKHSSGLASPQYALVPSFTPFDKRSRRERLDAILSGKASAPHISFGARASLACAAALALGLAVGQAALAVAPPPAQDALTVIPVEGRITSTFSERTDPVSKTKKHHQGVDIAAPTGTPVKAAGDGKVIAATARYNGSAAWGNVVVIDHGHGLVTRYAQLDRYIVRKGEAVQAGDAIGAVGATGRATGPHLHFEVLKDGEHIDPWPVVAPDAPAAPTAKTRKLARAPVTPAAPEARVAPEPRVAPTPPLNPDPTPYVDMAPPAAPALDAPPAPDDLTLGERLELRLAGNFDDWAAHVDASITDFESFENFSNMRVRFGEIELDGFDGAEDFAEALSGAEYSFGHFETLAETLPRVAFSFDGVELSDEDRKALEEASKNAKRAAAQARRDARREIERAKRDMARAERDRERMMRDIERANRDRERALRDAERERNRLEDLEARGESAMRLEELLQLREEALREAEQDLAEERAELERLRAELASEKRNED